MPFIKVNTSEKVSKDKSEELKAFLGKKIELLSGKSEKWLMVQIEDEKNLYFNGSKEACAMVEVNLYGTGNRAEYDDLSSEITKKINSLIEVPVNRIYIYYRETPYWSYCGELF